MDAEDARAQLQGFAEAVAMVEQAMFSGATAEAAAMITWGLLHQRLAHHPAAAVPLQVLAQVGEADAIAEWTRQLAGHPGLRGGVRPRRLLVVLARTRLRRGEAVQPVPPLAALWTCWRGARD